MGKHQRNDEQFIPFLTKTAGRFDEMLQSCPSGLLHLMGATGAPDPRRQSLDEIKKRFLAMVALLPYEPQRDYARQQINRAFVHFTSGLHSPMDQDGTPENLKLGIAAIADAALTATIVMSIDKLAVERATQMPLAKIHAEKAAAVERARTVAIELWQADIAQDIRIGDMAEQVYRALAAEGFAESLPGTVERIKEWIKPVAPDYARKGGRRRKTP